MSSLRPPIRIAPLLPISTPLPQKHEIHGFKSMEDVYAELSTVSKFQSWLWLNLQELMSVATSDRSVFDGLEVVDFRRCRDRKEDV
jgi:hypothetical protein